MGRNEELDNLFIALNKYKPSKNNPEENQFTQSFAWLLNSDKDLLKAIMCTLLQGKCKNISSLLSADDLCVYTQGSFNLEGYSYYPDLWIESEENELLIFVENKISAPKYIRQLSNYAQYLENNGPKFSFLILLARDYSIPVGRNFSKYKKYVYSRWEKIYDILKNYNSSTDKQYPLIKTQFLEYMEELGMDPFKGIKITLFSEWAEIQKQYRNKSDEIKRIVPYVLNQIKVELDSVLTFSPGTTRDNTLICWPKQLKDDWERKQFELRLGVYSYEWEEDGKSYPFCSIELRMSKGFKKFIKTTLSEYVNKNNYLYEDSGDFSYYKLLEKIIDNEEKHQTQLNLITSFYKDSILGMKEERLFTLIKKTLNKYHH